MRKLAIALSTTEQGDNGFKPTDVFKQPQRNMCIYFFVLVYILKNTYILLCISLHIKFIYQGCVRNYSGDMLHYLFHSRIMSLFTDAVSVWACARFSKYLYRIDKLQDSCQIWVFEIHRTS